MFYEESSGAKSPELTVMTAKNGQTLRCQPHLCPTELDVKKINTVYQCENVDRDSEFLDTQNQSQKQNCTSLKWKSFDRLKKKIDNPVTFKQTRGVKLYICRARVSNRIYALGVFYKYGCRGTNLSPFFWNLFEFDVLTNPNNVQINWISAKSPPENAVPVSNTNQNDSYVIKCASDRNSRHCLHTKYLIC